MAGHIAVSCLTQEVLQQGFKLHGREDNTVREINCFLLRCTLARTPKSSGNVFLLFPSSSFLISFVSYCYSDSRLFVFLFFIVRSEDWLRDYLAEYIDFR